MPSELEGIAYIQVLIQKESAQLVTANLSHMGAFPGSGRPPFSAVVRFLDKRTSTSKLLLQILPWPAPLPMPSFVRFLLMTLP